MQKSRQRNVGRFVDGTSATLSRVRFAASRMFEAFEATFGACSPTRDSRTLVGGDGHEVIDRFEPARHAIEAHGCLLAVCLYFDGNILFGVLHFLPHTPKR